MVRVGGIGILARGLPFNNRPTRLGLIVDFRRVLHVSGNANNGGNAGTFTFNGNNDSSNRNRNIGTQLAVF